MAIFSLPEGLNLKNAFSFLHPKDTGILGVDIGSSSIKIVQLRKEKERAILQTYGELSLAGYAKTAAGQPMVLVQDKLQEALRDVVREAQAKASRAVVSVPLKNSFVTTMSMPELTQGEMKEAIVYEARKYIPIPISETQVDWWVLPPDSTEAAQSAIGSGRRQFINVLLVAVPNDTIAKYKNIFSVVGLAIEAFEIESFALVRAALRGEGGTVLVMDMGASSTKTSIVDAGVVRATHNIDQGGRVLTQALQQSLGLDFERAELLKREFGVMRRPETQGAVSVLEPLIDVLMAEVERFVLEWRRKGGRSISKVVLAGGGALLRGVDEVVVKRFGVEAQIANPFSKVIYPPFLEPTLKEIGASFGNAVGLA